MTGVSLRTCARDGYLVAGRGVVVTLDGEDEARYSALEELCAKTPEIQPALRLKAISKEGVPGSSAPGGPSGTPIGAARGDTLA
jgi:hypothetical protein